METESKKYLIRMKTVVLKAADCSRPTVNFNIAVSKMDWSKNDQSAQSCRDSTQRKFLNILM